MNKFFGHLKTVRIHRRVVRHFCFKMGIPLQGLVHDLSKYSLKELSQYKYYTGKKSPHATMREEYGYSTSWYHHRNRNKHHWEYWIDSLEDRTAVKMPFKYVIEMLCDMCAAGYVYNGKKWQPKDVQAYWEKHNGPHRIINYNTLLLYTLLLERLSKFNDFNLFVKWYKDNKKYLKLWYKNMEFSLTKQEKLIQNIIQNLK